MSLQPPDQLYFKDERLKCGHVMPPWASSATYETRYSVTLFTITEEAILTFYQAKEPSHDLEIVIVLCWDERPLRIRRVQLPNDKELWQGRLEVALKQIFVD